MKLSTDGAERLRNARLKREMRVAKRGGVKVRKFVGTVIDINPWHCEFIPPISVETLMEIQETKNAIEEGFYVPLFRALSQMDKQMTVPEVQRRILENMVLLGPVVSRWQHEVMDPMLTRMYYEAGRQGLLPKIPEILRNRDFAPVYLSPLAKAQRASAIGDIQGFLQVIGGIAQFDPKDRKSVV